MTLIFILFPHRKWEMCVSKWMIAPSERDKNKSWDEFTYFAPPPMSFRLSLFPCNSTVKSDLKFIQRWRRRHSKKCFIAWSMKNFLHSIKSYCVCFMSQEKYFHFFFRSCLALLPFYCLSFFHSFDFFCFFLSWQFGNLSILPPSDRICFP